MNRRGFITLLGAAGLAPALPSLGGAAAGPSISISVYARAVGHARTRAQVTAKGLAYSLKISASQAEAVMAKLTAKGLIQPVAGAGHAVSRAGDANMWGIESTKMPTNNIQQPKLPEPKAERSQPEQKTEHTPQEAAKREPEPKHKPRVDLQETTQTGELIAPRSTYVLISCIALLIGSALSGSILLSSASGLISITALFGLVFLASGLMQLWLAWQRRETKIAWWLAASGVLSLVLAVLIIIHFYTATVTLTGIGLIMMQCKLTKTPETLPEKTT